MTSAYKDYAMNPAEHIKQAEKMAELATGVTYGEMGLVYSTLAVAHAQIAQAQMQGAMRA